MRTSIKAVLVGASALPLALATPGFAFAAEQTDTSCLTQAEHDTWVTKATSWYPAEQVKHQANLAAQNNVVAEAQSAVDAAQAQADDLAAQVKQANAKKNTALADIKYREGLITAMQAKLPSWQAKVETARDEIGTAQRDYRTAKNAGDTDAMDAAHAAAEEAREALAEAQAQVEHYTSGQVSAQNHIDRSQKIVDEATALGKRLYPQYQAQLGTVAQLTSTLEGEQAKLPALETKVANISKYITDSQAKADLPVCQNGEDNEEAPGAGDPTDGNAGGSENGTTTPPSNTGGSDAITSNPNSETTPSPTGTTQPAVYHVTTTPPQAHVVTVPATVATAKPVAIRPAATSAPTGGGQAAPAPSQLASTGVAGDEMFAVSLAGAALLASGIGLARRARATQ